MSNKELPPSRSPWKMVEGPNGSVVFVNPEHPARLLLGGYLQTIDAGFKPEDCFVQDRMYFASPVTEKPAGDSAFVKAMVEMKMRYQVIPQMELSMQEWDKVLGERMPRPWESKMRAPIHGPAGADWRES